MASVFIGFYAGFNRRRMTAVEYDCLVAWGRTAALYEAAVRRGEA